MEKALETIEVISALKGKVIFELGRKVCVSLTYKGGGGVSASETSAERAGLWLNRR